MDWNKDFFRENVSFILLNNFLEIFDVSSWRLIRRFEIVSFGDVFSGFHHHDHLNKLAMNRNDVSMLL